MIDAFASEPQYEQHVRPIFDALPDGIKGDWRRRSDNVTIVASYKDLTLTQRPAVFVEHGAGQTYGVGHPAYPGGRDRDNVRLFVCPSRRVAELNRTAYPNARAVVVGCPKMDRHFKMKHTRGSVVAFAFHWQAAVCPESGSAILHYMHHLEDVAARYETIATAHPRIIDAARGAFDEAGIPVVPSDEVLERADVLCVDNSSLGFEFMALDRPVVWLNAPWYRRDIEHGMRFWTYADAGVQVDEPRDLLAGIGRAFEDEREQRMRRHVCAANVYAYRDTFASHRAAQAIVETFGG